MDGCIHCQSSVQITWRLTVEKFTTELFDCNVREFICRPIHSRDKSLKNVAYSQLADIRNNTTLKIEKK